MPGDAPARVPSYDELYAEIERLEPGLTGEILEPGVLRVMPRPGRPHRRAAKELARLLGGFDVEHSGRGWWFESEAEIRLGVRLVVPDLAGWRVERVPAMPDESPITIVPDWCCEVLSPSNARDDRRIKLPLYAREGVSHVWLVEPEARLVEVFETREGRATLIASAVDTDVVALPPFLEEPLDYSLLWGATPPPAAP